VLDIPLHTSVAVLAVHCCIVLPQLAHIAEVRTQGCSKGRLRGVPRVDERAHEPEGATEAGVVED
jgi:hypothetical protein